MARSATISIFKFDELSPAAKEHARQWYRAGLDNDEFDPIVEDALECATLLGIEVAERSVKTARGGTFTEPAIYWGNMHCQGGGACFEGTYRYAKDCARAIRRHAPTTFRNRETGAVEQTSTGNAKLAEIADGLVALQKKYGYKLVARVKHSGHYYHEYCTEIDVRHETNRGDDSVCSEDETALQNLLRQFMRWIFAQLVAQDLYLTSDEAADEQLDQYEFTEDGKVWRGGDE